MFCMVGRLSVCLTVLSLLVQSVCLIVLYITNRFSLSKWPVLDMTVCLSVSLSKWPVLDMTICLSVSLSEWPVLHITVCLSISLSEWPVLHMTVCLSVCLHDLSCTWPSNGQFNWITFITRIFELYKTRGISTKTFESWHCWVKTSNSLRKERDTEVFYPYS